MSSRPPLPPFTPETASQKARLAEDAWNSRDPQRVALAYTEDSRWRNRVEFIEGRAAIIAFLDRKWAREFDYSSYAGMTRSRGLEALARRLLGPRRTTEEPTMKREDLTEKILDMKREKGWSWKHICAEIGGMAPDVDRRRAARPDEAREAARPQGRRTVRSLRRGRSDAQRSPASRDADAADRSVDLSLLRARHGHRPRVEGADRRGIWRRHHVGDRFQPRLRAGGPTRKAIA